MSVREMVRNCHRCELRAGCKAPVPIDGPLPCNLLVVGEAPGAAEDSKGSPFVGMAGKTMRSMLWLAGFHVAREVAWCNVVSCRPPNNRDPHEDEIDACRVNFQAQVMLANPRVVLLTGKVALKSVRADLDGITQHRGRPLWLKSGQVAIPTFHPAAVLRRKQWEESLQEDCRLAKRWVEDSAAQAREWPEDCAVCGLDVEVYDWMGVPYCKYHKHMNGLVLKRAKQERLAI